MAYELKQISKNTYYLPGAVNIGVVTRGSDCLVVDTGLDRQAGKQIVKALEQAGLTAKVIINTHSHADHFGGNGPVMEQAGAKIYASAFEKAIIENPQLEPFYLFSASPVKDMVTRFLMAPASKVDGTLTPGTCTLEGFDLEIIPLPGHSPDQIGVVTADNVLFCGDAYFGITILDKYGMPYTADVTSALETLNLLKQSSYQYYAPCHGEISEDPTEDIDKNIAVVEKTLDQITAVLAKKQQTREEVLAEIITINNRKLDAVQYLLNHSTISACLAHLHKTKKADYVFKDGKMLWFNTEQ